MSTDLERVAERYALASCEVHHSHEDDGLTERPCASERADAITVLSTDPQLVADVELGAAWREAEAALPEGWSFWELTGYLDDGVVTVFARVRVANVIGHDGSVPEVNSQGSTPAIALRALATQLRAGI